jgi:hypothetical protein
MGFNFGAFLGGAASQIVQDIDEQEKEVKLRTRTILDRQVAEAAENRKKFNDDKEKVEKQITSIAQLFGEDDPFRFNKARSIVAGGDEHYNTMYKELSTHKRLGGDMKQAYDYTAANEEQGFEGVADAAKGLAKLRTISAPEFTESVRSEGQKLFGIDSKSMYEKARSQYEQAGLLPSSKAEFDDSVKKYGTGTINFQNLKRDKKDIDTMYANNMQSILELDKSDPKYAEKRAKLEAEQEELTKGVAKMNSVSASVIAEKERQAGKDTTGKTLTEMRTLYTSSRSQYKKSLGQTADGVTDDNGNEIFEKKDADAYVEKKMKEWDKNYVKGLVDGNGNLIDNSSDSQSFLKAYNLDQYVGTPKEKDDTKVESKKETKKEKVDKLKQENPELNETVARNLLELNQGTKTTITNPMQLSDMLMQTYPKKADETQEAYEERMDGLAQIVWSKYTEEKKASDAEKKRLAELRKKRFGDAVPEDKMSEAQKRAEARKGKR